MKKNTVRQRICSWVEEKLKQQKFLFIKSSLNFENFFKTSDCVRVNNGHGFWPHQGAGGRIFLVDEDHILFTTGDFRNRPLAQNPESDFGKILKVDPSEQGENLARFYQKMNERFSIKNMAKAKPAEIND